jgi:hypothetical protein
MYLVKRTLFVILSDIKINLRYIIVSNFSFSLDSQVSTSLITPEIQI